LFLFYVWMLNITETSMKHKVKSTAAVVYLPFSYKAKLQLTVLLKLGMGTRDGFKNKKLLTIKLTGAKLHTVHSAF